MYTIRRQSSRIAAFLLADTRPMFCWRRSASIAGNQMWLGLPNGRFQSGSNPGSPQRQHGDDPLVVMRDNMTGEPQTSVSDQMGKRTASGGCCDFHIRHIARSVWYHQDLV